MTTRVDMPLFVNDSCSNSSFADCWQLSVYKQLMRAPLSRLVSCACAAAAAAAAAAAPSSELFSPSGVGKGRFDFDHRLIGFDRHQTDITVFSLCNAICSYSFCRQYFSILVSNHFLFVFL